MRGWGACQGLRNSPFRHRNFRLFAIGHVLSLAGNRFQEIAAGWLMWQLTGSVTWLGLLVLADIIPRLLFWPLSGLIADRLDRRRVAMLFQSIAAVEVTTIALLQFAGLVTPLLLLAANALLGLNNVFWQPVRLALITRLVPFSEMTRAIALMSVLSNVARIGGPLLAAPIIAFGGVELAFAINATSFIAIVLILKMMHLSAEQTKPTPIGGANAGLWSGVRLVAAHPGVRPLFLLIGVFAITVRPVADLLPAFAEVVFAQGASGFAALVSAMGVGSVLAGMLLSFRSFSAKLTTMMAILGIVAALATAALASTSIFVIGLLCIGLYGVGVTGLNIIAQTLIQLAVDDAIRGRVFSFYFLVFSSSPAVGALLLGGLADQIGIGLPVQIAALIGLAVTTIIFIRRRELADHLKA